MDKKIDKIQEKTEFSDTGSQILQENQEQSTNNSENPSNNINNQEKTSNFTKSIEKTEEFHENCQETEEKLSFFYTEEQEKEFKALYPAVDLDGLKKNKEFSYLLKSIEEKPTLAKIYSSYLSVLKELESKALKKAKQLVANEQVSVGALSSSAESKDVFFTKEQVLQMSQEQIRKHYSKIRQSQEKW